MTRHLHSVPADPTLDEIRERSARELPVKHAGDIYADTRQLWRDEDRWRRMWLRADKARKF